MSDDDKSCSGPPLPTRTDKIDLKNYEQPER